MTFWETLLMFGVDFSKKLPDWFCWLVLRFLLSITTAPGTSPSDIAGRVRVFALNMKAKYIVKIPDT